VAGVLDGRDIPAAGNRTPGETFGVGRQCLALPLFAFAGTGGGRAATKSQEAVMRHFADSSGMPVLTTTE
jgi:hypothetical protein